MLAAACAPQEYHADTPSLYETAASCAQVNRDNLYTAAGYFNAHLTVATGEPAFPPWWDNAGCAPARVIQRIIRCNRVWSGVSLEGFS